VSPRLPYADLKTAIEVSDSVRVSATHNHLLEEAGINKRTEAGFNLEPAASAVDRYGSFSHRHGDALGYGVNRPNCAPHSEGEHDRLVVTQKINL
jgi:hypothetical protein